MVKPKKKYYDIYDERNEDVHDEIIMKQLFFQKKSYETIVVSG